MRRLQQRYPSEPGARNGPGRVVRTSEPELIADIDDVLVSNARNAEHFALLRGL